MISLQIYFHVTFILRFEEEKIQYTTSTFYAGGWGAGWDMQNSNIYEDTFNGSLVETKWDFHVDNTPSKC